MGAKFECSHPIRGMARKPRAEYEPGVYHVYARRVDRQRLFVTDADRITYLGLLEKVTLQRSWRTMAYCLMGSHMHLLVETVEPNLGAGMQRLHGAYAQRFRARHGGSGHVFEGRFKGTLITSDAQLQVTAAYVVLNPVDAGLCSKPEEWEWSSHRAALGDATPPPWLDVSHLHDYFGAAGGDATKRYAQLVQERKEARAAARRPGLGSSDWDDAQFATPEGDWERIHSRSVSSPTRA